MICHGPKNRNKNRILYPVNFQQDFQYFLHSKHTKHRLVAVFSTLVDVIDTESAIVNKQFGTCNRIFLHQFRFAKKLNDTLMLSATNPSIVFQKIPINILKI